MISAYSLVTVIGWKPAGRNAGLGHGQDGFGGGTHIRPVNGRPAGALAVNRM